MRNLILILALFICNNVYSQEVEYKFFKPTTVREYDKGILVNTSQTDKFKFIFISDYTMVMEGLKNPVTAYNVEKSEIDYSINGVKYSKEGTCYYFKYGKMTIELILIYHTDVHCNYTIVIYDKLIKLMSFSGEFLMIPVRD